MSDNPDENETYSVAQIDVVHIVCHCTDGEMAYCGFDASDSPWDDAEDEACPMCEAMWESDLPCPGGCGCEECAW